MPSVVCGPAGQTLVECVDLAAGCEEYVMVLAVLLLLARKPNTWAVTKSKRRSRDPLIDPSAFHGDSREVSPSVSRSVFCYS